MGFAEFSLLGWSDGGITALIAAGKNADLIRKMVVWGSNAFVTQQDLQLYNGTSFHCRNPVPGEQCAMWALFFFYRMSCICTAVRDVSKWSARMRQPMEEMYGAEVFAKTWEAWVDGISKYAKRPEGTNKDKVVEKKENHEIEGRLMETTLFPKKVGRLPFMLSRLTGNTNGKTSLRENSVAALEKYSFWCEGETVDIYMYYLL